MKQYLLTFYHRRPRLALMVAAALCVAAFGTIIFGAHDAFALKITMKRVIFEGTKRAEVLTLINNTADEMAFRIGWRNMRMGDKGLQEIPEGEDLGNVKPLDKMVVFAPRRVVIAPGGSQQIRLMLRKPKDLAEGEYRSHLWVRPEAEAAKFDPNPVEGGKSAVQIKMLAGVSVPVFIRHGQMTATAKLENAALKSAGGKQEISFDLLRQGNRSIYGDLDFICTSGAEEKVLRQVRGIAIYTDVEKRSLKYDFPAGSACSAMRVVYTADKDDPLFKGNVIAQTTAAAR